MSLPSTAIAIPRLRCVALIAIADMNEYGPESEAWLVALFDDFLSNCPDLVDISLDHCFPFDQSSRIAGLDTLCASLGARRKVGVRVDDYFYKVRHLTDRNSDTKMPIVNEEMTFQSNFGTKSS